MNRLHKIAGFTMVEVLMALALSVVFVRLALLGWSIIHKNVSGIQRNITSTNQINLLEQQLLVDFAKYSNVMLNEGTVSCSNEIEEKKYHFEENYIIKDDDTLVKNDTEANFYFKGVLVNQGKVDAIKLSFLSKDGTFIFVKRTLDGTNYINFDEN